jgi:hypothetical protein
MVTIVMFRSHDETSKVRYKFVYHPEVSVVFHSADTDEFSLPTALEEKCTKYKENFLGAIQKSVPLNKPIFMNLTITQRHYVMILCSKFHPNRSCNMGRGVEIHLRP